VTWTCTNGSTAANVNSAISSARNNAVITLKNGTYTGTGIDVAAGRQNGVTVICESVGGCTFISNGDVFATNTCGADITNLVRISGFVFSGAPSTGKIWLYCSDGFNIEQVRIDHNTFNNFAGSQAVFFGETRSEGEVYGVVDHNTFTSATSGMAMKNISGGTDWEIGLQGSARNLFFEDNTITIATSTDLGLGAVDAWKAGGTVVRYNTVLGSRVLTHSLCHDGPVNWEVYGNTVDNPTGKPNDYRNIHSQGSGEIIIFDNTVENDNGNAIVIQHYRSDNTQLPQGSCAPTTELCDGDFVAGNGIPRADGNRVGQSGYPCWHQPGRDGAGTLKPVYLWNNRTAGGTRVDLDVESRGLISSHFVANRDYYQAPGGVQTSSSSPFNGSEGVGFGPLANRPATCTAGPGGADGTNGGVGYFATDENKLYRCSATDTWTLHYTPYTYPHPLVGGQR
jgi:hypothetical protein